MGSVVSLADEKKKRRRRAGSLAWLWITLLLLGCLVFGYGLAQSSIFNVRTVQVDGLNRLTKAEVITLSGIQTGTHIYETNLTKAQNMIATNLWVETVTVERKLPSTVVITVQERVPAAALTTADGLYVVDTTGVLLMQQKLLDGLAVLVISGVEDISADVRLGTKLESFSLTAALAVIRQMDESSAAVISELNVADLQRIVAHTSYGVDFYLGDKSNFAEKFKLAMQILHNEIEKGLQESVDYIDVTLPQQPVLAYLS